MSKILNETMFEETLSTVEAFSEARVAPTFLYRDLYNGRLPARKSADGKWEISRAGFNEWLIGVNYRRRQRKPASEQINEVLHKISNEGQVL